MSQPPDRTVMAAAIDWMVLLQSGQTDADVEQRLQHWLRGAPAHRQAWAELQQIQQRLQGVREIAARHPDQARQTRALLQRSRRTALRSLAALAIVGGGAACWAERRFPLLELDADLRTATAQRRQFGLTDGSRILLDARSAADLRMEARQRQVWLRRGRMLLEVAADPRPLLLYGRHVRASLQHGRVMLANEDDSSVLCVLDGDATLQAATGERVRLQIGRAARAGAKGIALLADDTAALADWVKGQIRLDNAPLAQLVAQMRPYRSGFLRVSDTAARLRVHGVFSLDDSDRTLTALSETLPVAIHRYGPLTLIDRR